MQQGDPRNPDLSVGDRIGGYIIEKIIEIPESASMYYELSHGATGARHVHISRPDTENAFAVTLKTVPRDSTGVAHILEHTALCGSAKYPVKDPFFSMLKRSLNTFMNALTASDWTMYPFATQNRKDYYNLMSVYLDSVFNPRLDRLSFMQEGHRIEVESQGEDQGLRLVYKGVVYNEMKGAMSSPDQVMGRSMLNALYPDTTYSYNSGGKPEEIPKLTHSDLLRFHRDHYHPSNAFFYTYGTFPLDDHLAFIEKNVLSHYQRIDPETDVPSQPRWEEPRTATYHYPADPEDDLESKCQACVAWLGPDIRDAFEVLVMTVVEQVLIGNSGSPLRKALIDSGLGSTLSDGSGYDSENKDTMFACGLKDVSEDAAQSIHDIIFNTLRQLVADGIDRRLVETALHQIEFHRKEISNAPYPYGLKLLLRFCGDWIHQGDPATTLLFTSLLDRFYKELDAGQLLENHIRKHLLDNPHRVLITLKPDPGLSEAQLRRETAELEKLRATLSDADIRNIIEDAEKLAARQDEQEDVSCLPTLKLEDISPDINTLSESGMLPDYAITQYEQPTSGIFYYTAVLGLSSIPEKLSPLIPLFCHTLTRIGAKDADYVEIARRIDQYTGGLGLMVSASNHFHGGENTCMPLVTFSGKCLSRNIGKMLDIVKTLVCDFDFTDLQRLKTLLLEVRSDMESSVVNNGHRLAISLAARNFSSANTLNESWHGIHQLKSLKKLTDDLSEEILRSISEDLTSIANSLFYKNNIKTAITGGKTDLETATRILESIHDRLDANPDAGFNPPQYVPEPEMPYEGWATSTAVSFVARVIETTRMDHADAPALAVLSKLLKSMYLHREIREKGGAYGGFSIYQLENGLFYFGSYRDPHIENTIRVYDAARGFIASGNYTEADIQEAILQVCADFDHPDSPQGAARKRFYQQLIGLSDDMRREFKKNLLKVNADQVRSLGKRYFEQEDRPSGVAVISSEEKLSAANEKLGGKMKIYRI
jgi:presequence protease